MLEDISDSTEEESDAEQMAVKIEQSTSKSGNKTNDKEQQADKTAQLAETTEKHTLYNKLTRWRNKVLVLANQKQIIWKFWKKNCRSKFEF